MGARGAAPRHLERWKVKYGEFCQPLKEAKAEADDHTKVV